MKKKGAEPVTTPGEVISPLEHTHGNESLSEPGEVPGTMNQTAELKGKSKPKESARERLSKAPEDRRGITIGPTTRSGPDITVE